MFGDVCKMPLENKIFNFLREKGCCKCCAIRYLGNNKTIDFYNIDEYIKKNNYEEPTITEHVTDPINSNCDFQIKKSKSNSCIVCLGLLQDFVMEDAINNVLLSEIQKYDTKVFTCSISIPAASQIREYALKICLKEKFPEFYTQDIEEIPLNKIWKLIFKERLSQKLNLVFENSDICNFSINVTMDYQDNHQELGILKKLLPEKVKQSYSRKFICNLLMHSPPKDFKDYIDTILTIPTKPVNCSLIECKHNSVYLAGRYTKYSRELSQSPWIIDGVKTMETSVEEIIFEQFKYLFDIEAKKLKFSASGREDCDVRCLGKGRPFYVEILDPKKTVFSFEEFRRLENAINVSSLIKVRDLQMVDRVDLKNIKEGEEMKTKDYIALCLSKYPITKEQIDKINSMDEITLKQKTPIRVLHRRPLAVREKKIYDIKAKEIPDNENLFILNVVTQAGTYIKEFVHGDFGRTTPNLGEIIGSEVDIIALDVIAINLDWPKEVKEN